MTDSKFRSRRFQLACYALGMSSIMVFTGHLTGELWLGAIGLVLGLYGATRVGSKAMEVLRK